ncbi:MAG: RidA family protein [Chlorobi bacterium]|nr:RidA family protein [Chlorobiota bacterium]MCI0716445.1 RidA family protein [Chlorobiota bacterium]
MKKIITTEKAPKPVGPYSQAVSAVGFLFISGQIPINPATGNIAAEGIKEQTRQVMENLKAILNASEMDFTSVVKSTLFIKDMGKFSDVNEVYGSYFSAEPPARETIEVSRLPKDADIEISMIAFKA